jgi:hypothetical protein
MERRTDTPMRFWRRRRARRATDVALLLIQLEQLALDTRGHRPRPLERASFGSPRS